MVERLCKGKGASIELGGRGRSRVLLAFNCCSAPSWKVNLLSFIVFSLFFSETDDVS